MTWYGKTYEEKEAQAQAQVCSEEVSGKVKEVEAARASGNARLWKDLIKKTGWKHSSIVWDWAEDCSFDAIKDTAHDGMHLFATITRDLAHAQVDVLEMVKLHKVAESFMLEECLKEFKSGMPSSLRHARR